MVQEAVILAGGLGTRLRPVVTEVPKPLAPVAGRPFLHWLLGGLAKQGIRRVVLATGYRADLIRQCLGDRHADIDLAYSPEATPLGTGGALWAALAQCREDRVAVLNGDTWLGLDIAALAGEAPQADIVLAIRDVADRARYGSVQADGNRLLALEEKGLLGPGLVNGGAYLVRTDLPRRRPMPSAFALEQDVLAQPKGLDIRVHRTAAPFLDIGTPEDFDLAQELIPRWAAS
ncbi:NTP transferase domain-containing protein [Roseomonas terrae]|uniref:NTP transferase domain-containing protein n=1 Tax=Neoroseomonas terrae TaxID=424799 RepID=A0ABS5EG39_9PROT|nr:nucleotidyltransferase family protein [Neoroseomonas terrae]MBR0649980.1 NTP transferase domain-containing protein [Neoroseomonas terrae]